MKKLRLLLLTYFTGCTLAIHSAEKRQESYRISLSWIFGAMERVSKDNPTDRDEQLRKEAIVASYAQAAATTSLANVLEYNLSRLAYDFEAFISLRKKEIVLREEELAVLQEQNRMQARRVILQCAIL